MPRRLPSPVLQDLLRHALIGVGRIGGRAAASAAKSVMRDGRRIAKEVEDRLSNAEQRIQDMVGGDSDDKHHRGDE